MTSTGYRPNHRTPMTRTSVLAFLACCAYEKGAQAELPSQVERLDTSSDGVYGRMQGDVMLSARAHAEFSPGGVAPGGRLAAHYFWMAGVYAGFDRPLATPALDRVWGFGVEARPAFIPRWASGKQLGPGFADLTLDSISLSIGAYFAQAPDAAPRADRGLEVGLGFGLPLTGRAQGLWFESRTFLRHPDGEGEQHYGVQLGLGWHVAWLSPLTAR